MAINVLPYLPPCKIHSPSFLLQKLITTCFEWKNSKVFFRKRRSQLKVTSDLRCTPGRGGIERQSFPPPHSAPASPSGIPRRGNFVNWPHELRHRHVCPTANAQREKRNAHRSTRKETRESHCIIPLCWVALAPPPSKQIERYKSNKPIKSKLTYRQSINQSTERFTMKV